MTLSQNLFVSTEMYKNKEIWFSCQCRNNLNKLLRVLLYLFVRTLSSYMCCASYTGKVVKQIKFQTSGPENIIPDGTHAYIAWEKSSPNE